MQACLASERGRRVYQAVFLRRIPGLGVSIALYWIRPQKRQPVWKGDPGCRAWRHGKEASMADLADPEMLVAWTVWIDSFMPCTYILVILLVFVGIYYTIRTKAVQIHTSGHVHSADGRKEACPGQTSHLILPGPHGVHRLARVGAGNIAGIATAVATGGSRRHLLDVAHGAYRRGFGLHRVHARRRSRSAAKEGEFREPGLHPAGPREALARHHFRLGAHPVLRLRLQRAAGLHALDLGAGYYIPDYATNGTAVGVCIHAHHVHRFHHFRRQAHPPSSPPSSLPIIQPSPTFLLLWTTITTLASCPRCSPPSSGRPSTSSPSPVALPFGGHARHQRGLFSMRPAWARPRTPPPPPACRIPLKQGPAVQSLSVYIDTLLICAPVSYDGHGVLGAKSRGCPWRSTACRSLQMAVNNAVGEVKSFHHLRDLRLRVLKLTSQ